MNIKEAKNEIKNAVRIYVDKDENGKYRIPREKQRPVLLVGAPGIGKTAIMSAVATELDIGFLGYTITHHTRQSAIGLPFISQKEFGGKTYSVTEYTMSEIVASVYEAIEKQGKKEGILFIDEINCVSETLAPAMLELLQHKKFGAHEIPEGWILTAAGNPPEYNKSVNELDMVTLDRVKRLNVVPDYDAFKEYALNNGMHGAIVYYLSLHNEYMFKAEKTVDGYDFVTPRGWEDLSVAIFEYERLSIPVTLQFVSEYVQDGKIASEFFAYYKRYCECADVYGGEDAETGKIKKIDVEDKGFEVRYALANLIAAKVIKLAEKYRARKTAEDELAAIETAVKDGVGSLSSETEKLMKECNSQKRSRYERAALKKLLVAFGETDEKAGVEKFRVENDAKLADYKTRIDNLFNFAVNSLGKGQEIVAMLMEVIACEHFIEILPYLGDTVFYDLNDSLLGVSGEDDYKRLAASALKGE